MGAGGGNEGEEGRTGGLTITDLLSYRVHRLASILSRSAAVRYRRDFDVSLGEWRALALLGAYAPLSLNQLAREADLDKGQMSRVVSGLVERGLVSRGSLFRRDSRGLFLTPSGRRTHEGLMRAAAERNEAFLACLTPEETEALESAMAKLSTLGRALAGAGTPRAAGSRPAITDAAEKPAQATVKKSHTSVGRGPTSRRKTRARDL